MGCLRRTGIGMFKFESLNIWKEAVKFVSEIYKLTKKFPNWETYSLISQLNRAAISISLNIAEGSSRISKKDFKRFIQISLGSLNEVVTCLYIAKNENYLDSKEFNKLYGRCEDISKMLYGFNKYLER